MKSRYIPLIAFIISICSCHKDPTPAPLPTHDTVVRLKDMNERNLATPYYHFEYNASGDIIHTSFSGDLSIYDVIYTGKKIVRMENKNQPNMDVLEYVYIHDTLAVIKVINKNGENYRRVFLGYFPSGQLQTIDWEVKVSNAGFEPENSLQFSYHPDGNLKELTNHNYAVGPQLASTVTDKFDNYDDKVNVDAFSLLHPDLIHHLYLLPEVKLQTKNPRRVVRTGDGITYGVDYTYTYDAKGRPTVKSGDVLWTSGPNAGNHFNEIITFSYYD